MVWWWMLVIPGLQEAKVRQSQVQNQPGLYRQLGRVREGKEASKRARIIAWIWRGGGRDYESVGGNSLIGYHVSHILRALLKTWRDLGLEVC